MLTASHYTEAQRLAWAPKPPDLNSWRSRLSGLSTLVADAGDRTAGFLSYEENGHIDLLYVAPGFERCGIASRLMDALETNAAKLDLYTEASLIAEPFFAHRRFRTVERQRFHFRGVEFQRCIMVRERSIT